MLLPPPLFGGVLELCGGSGEEVAGANTEEEEDSTFTLYVVAAMGGF